MFNIQVISCQTILEQQRVIRRLLRKSLTDTNGTNNVSNQSQSTSNNICRVIEDILPDNCFTSDPEDDNEPGERNVSSEALEKLLKDS